MVNYGKSVIYKLCCKDSSILDEYIGSTTNKSRRKNEHKSDCNNENKNCYDYKVYKFIRENGGFENWDLIILEEYPCENKNQLIMRERYWIEERKPTLNSRNSIQSREERIEYMKKINKKYRQTKHSKEYTKKYNRTYHQRRKIENASAIIIQIFFKKYFNKLS